MKLEMKFLASAKFGDFTHSRSNNFNLLRMVAASSVIISHAYPISLGPGALEPLQGHLDGKSLGTVAVITFFAISGFLITKSYDRTENWKYFLLARGVRLVPALACVLILTVLVASFLTVAPISVFLTEAGTYVISNLMLVKIQYSLPGVFEDNPFGPAINGSLWTLFYEVGCYFGVLVLGLAGLLGSRFAISMLVAGLFAAQAASSWVSYPDRAETMVQFGLPFAFGCWVYVMRHKLPMSVPLAILSLVVSLALRGTVLFDGAFATSVAYAILVLSYVRFPPLLQYNRFGDYSYGTYLFAFPIQQFIASFGITSPFMNIALSFPITVAMAFLSWSFVEAPALAWLHRPLSR